MSAGNRDPFAFARDDADDGLVRLEQELARLKVIAERGEDEDEEWPAFFAVDRQILTTPPTSMAGVKAKLRRLLDPEIGIEIGGGDNDVLALQQILAFLDSQGGAS
jgi:hypothetical protein